MEILVLQSSINLCQEPESPPFPLWSQPLNPLTRFARAFQHDGSYMIFPPVNVSEDLRKMSPACFQGPRKSPACQCFQFTKISPKTKTNAVAATTSNYMFRVRLLCSSSCIIHPSSPQHFSSYYFQRKMVGRHYNSLCQQPGGVQMSVQITCGICKVYCRPLKHQLVLFIDGFRNFFKNKKASNHA